MIAGVCLHSNSPNSTNHLAELEEEDFQKIFTFMHNLEDVNLRFAGQLKDPVLQYMLDHNTKIKHLQLGAANLVSDKSWTDVFHSLGGQLESLKLSELNDSMGDEMVQELAANCKKLNRLKLAKCSKMSGTAIAALSALQNLEHLSLNVSHYAPPVTLRCLIEAIGKNLRTLSLEEMYDADDTVLEAIHENCQQLRKLRFTGNCGCTDEGFARLFDKWSNLPLRQLDLNSNRDIENVDPDGDGQTPIGLASEGFQAMMAHSRSGLQRLNVSSCRHISHEALSAVFDGKKEYPQLEDIDMSFLPMADDFLLEGLFKSCPKLKKLVVFGCFKVKCARIPRGVILVGMANAYEAMVMEG